MDRDEREAYEDMLKPSKCRDCGKPWSEHPPGRCLISQGKTLTKALMVGWALILVATLAGCVAVPVGPPVVYGPAPVYEVIVAAPFPFVWIGPGYYSGRYYGPGHYGGVYRGGSPHGHGRGYRGHR